MRDITFSPQAKQDLIRLHGFIAVYNPEAAARAAEHIKAITRSLAELPLTGGTVGSAKNIRQFPIEFGKAEYIATAFQNPSCTSCASGTRRNLSHAGRPA